MGATSFKQPIECALVFPYTSREKRDALTLLGLLTLLLLIPCSMLSLWALCKACALHRSLNGWFAVMPSPRRSYRRLAGFQQRLYEKARQEAMDREEAELRARVIREANLRWEQHDAQQVSSVDAQSINQVKWSGSD